MSYEDWPTISSIHIREFLFAKYPTQPTISLMFLSAINQKLLDNRIAWSDLGIIDPQKQKELELEVDKLIEQIASGLIKS